MEGLWSLLLVLGCPVAMALMLWLMPRGSTSHASGSPPLPTADTAGVQPAASLDRQGRPLERQPRLAGLCLDWRVLAGLAVVGVGILALAPGSAAVVLPLLLLAACPLSMLVMMRGMASGQCASQPGAPDPVQNEELTAEERLARLKAEQAALARRIALFEAAHGLAGREAPEITPAAVGPAPAALEQPPLTEAPSEVRSA